MRPVGLAQLAEGIRPPSSDVLAGLSSAVRRRFFLESLSAEQRKEFLEKHPDDLFRLKRAALKRALKERR